jgi:hypothetical protein
MEFLIVLAILMAVVLFVTVPFRRPTPAGAGEIAEASAASQRAELEAAREAKYREIRDAELDHRTGKLSDADYEAVDRSLRGEAVDILRELDRLGGPSEPLPSPER